MFVTAAQLARLSTRYRTQILDLTRVKPSVVGETVLPDDWLAIMIDRLPSLHSLIVHDLSAFDHGSLKAFHRFMTLTRLTADRLPSSLRLLTASSVTNAISSSLAHALNCFPALIYLDLSSTRVVNKLNFLEQISSFKTFPALEILKLRNIGLTNYGVWQLAVGLGTRVWSLDIRRNQLSDPAVEILLEYCFLPDDHVFSESYHDEQMQYMGEPGPSDDELSVVRRLAKSKPSRLRQHQAGITHLYISDNDISTLSAQSLIKSWRLTALDVGQLKIAEESRSMVPKIYHDAFAADAFRESLHMQMVDGARLRYLRIDHSFITGDACLLDRGISPIKDGFNFWPSGDLMAARGEAIGYDKNFPGLGLHTLVLAGLPNTSDKGWITKTLLAFLLKCTEMERDIRNDPRALDAEGHPSSILRELHLEMPDIFEHELLGGTVEDLENSRPVDQDFSFFREEESEDDLLASRALTDEPEAARLTEGNAFKGQIADKLMSLRRVNPTSWTGRVSIVRPLGPEERDSLVPSRYTFF